jgi:hypothetical protein
MSAQNTGGSRRLGPGTTLKMIGLPARSAHQIPHQAKPPATAVVHHGAELWCAEAERITPTVRKW